MLVDLIDNNGSLELVSQEKGELNYFLTNMPLPPNSYEASSNTTDNKKYVKDAIKLKEAGFTSDEIIELIGAR